LFISWLGYEDITPQSFVFITAKLKYRRWGHTK